MFLVACPWALNGEAVPVEIPDFDPELVLWSSGKASEWGASLSDEMALRFAANDMKYVGKTANSKQLTISLAPLFRG